MPRQVNRLSLTLLLSCLFIVSGLHAQDAAQSERRLIGYTSEFWGRSWATKQVLPTYPAEAIAHDIQGVIEVAVGINNDGQVFKVHIPPGLDPRLREAAVAAAKQWKFVKRANTMPPGEYCIFRLTFNFVIEEGAPRVELYNPPRDSPEHARMRGASPRMRTEWLSWEDATNDQ
jgi:TonB family protein